MDERERSALMRLGRGFLAFSIVSVGALVAGIVVRVIILVAGYQFDVVSMRLSVIMIASLVALFIMALILLGLRELSRVDGSLIVGYVGVVVLMLGYSAMALVAAAALLAGEAMLEAMSQIMDTVTIVAAVSYVATFVFFAVKLWMRYRHPLYIVAAMFYAALIAVQFLSQVAPSLFSITANALMYIALRATIHGDVDS